MSEAPPHVPATGSLEADRAKRAALDAAADKHETPSGDGVMVWRKWGSGQPVVLLHGGSGSWTHWIRTIPDLIDGRDGRPTYEVWAADLPGLGDSAMPHEPFVPQSCAEVVADGLRTLIPYADRPRLVGFSFGAHVGSFAARLLGDHIASFTIIGTSALGIPRPALEEFPKERSTMTPADRLNVHRRVLEILMISKPERIDDFAVELQRDNVRAARFRSRKFAPTDNVKRALADVSAPLRSIWGRNDIIAHPNVETCLGVIGEHHPELVAEIVEDAGHWVMYEQPGAFNAALRRMLAL
jgi:2-hydroxy-6-oxonona-2,4-dienedioate hydrolase